MKPVYINGIRGMCDNASLHVTEQLVPGAGAVLGGFSCTGTVWYSRREIRDMLLQNRVLS